MQCILSFINIIFYMKQTAALTITSILFFGGLATSTAQCPYFTKVVTSYNGHHMLGIKNDGTLWAWGNNGFGQLGDGSTTDRAIPTQIGSASNWTDIAAGSYHSLGITADGKLWAWGFNAWLSLGDGTSINRNTPTQIGSAINWRNAGAGDIHSFGISTAGKLYAWGYNGNGQLGNGNSTSSNIPIPIAPAINWKMITGGKYHSAGITDDDRLFTWGANSAGQLGDGTTIGKNLPVQIGPAGNWATAACGYDISAGVTTDGKLFTWGQNDYGQLGNGTIGAGTNLTTPAQVGSGTNWKNVSLGWDHTHALTTDGKGWAWGYNNSGQFGNGNNSNSLVPVPFGTPYNFTDITAGTFYAAAITTDQQALAWGSSSTYGATGSAIGIDNIPYTITNPQTYSGLANTGSASTRQQSTLTYYDADCAHLIAAVAQTNAASIVGSTTTNVWVDIAQTSEYAKRHYQVWPVANAATATGRITLYATQAEFDDFNNQLPAPPLYLPTGSGDAFGKSVLRIERKDGTSADNTGLPRTYPGPIATINPNDADIIWNSTASRWEISFTTTGFGGFFIKPLNILIILPVKWMELSGILTAQHQALISWKVQEQQTNHYEIEKSADGIHFTGIALVSSKNDGINNYSYTVASIINNTTFFRIKQVDKNGAARYAEVIKINPGAQLQAAAFPNPAMNHTFISAGRDLLNTKAVLTDISGRTLQTFIIHTLPYQLPLYHLTSGIYFLKTTGGGSVKIIKQ